MRFLHGAVRWTPLDGEAEDVSIAPMNETRARAIAWASLGVSATLCAGAAVFLVLAWDVPVQPTEFGTKGYAIVWSLVIAVVGAIIASRRPSNPIGWILCGMGVLSGLLALSLEYARWALVERSGEPPLGLYAAWLGEWVWIPLLVCLSFVAAVFPDGRPISTRWRNATYAAAVASVPPMALNAMLPRLTIYEGLDNPVGLDAAGITDALGVVNVLLLPIIFVGVGAVVARLRRATGEERLQLKWFALAMGLVAAMFGVYGAQVLIQGTAAPTGSGMFGKVLEYLTILSLLGVPVSVGFGVLKYRLYDIDLVIKKTVVFGVVATGLTLVAALVLLALPVGILGTGLTGRERGLFLVGVAIGTLFGPLRRIARRWADRLVYGKRATPYEVLTAFGERVGETYATEDVLPRLAQLLANGTGASSARVLLRIGPELREVARWPADPDTSGEPEHTTPVADRGEELGALALAMPQNDPMDPSKQKLVRDLASQVGLLLRNVRLVEELRASRQRLVEAQDEERRRIERDIHDGVQQQLVALAVRLQLLEQQISAPPAAKETAAGLRADATTALEDLRDLARGIFPPLLADQGLAAALDAQIRKAALPVVLETDGIDRYPRVLESAVYFCTLEALNNVAKYARASRARVRLAAEAGHLRFEVIDDGVGFDPTAVTRGTGLQGMADRVEVLGGSLEVRSEPGRGTTVVGAVPIG